jgi:hypothetical protein
VQAEKWHVSGSILSPKTALLLFILLSNNLCKMKHFYKIFSLLLLLSCGGGGASSSEAVIPPTQNIPPQPLFKESPIRINDDGFIDFIAHFWCDSITPADFDDQPVKDALS